MGANLVGCPLYKVLICETNKSEINIQGPRSNFEMGRGGGHH